MLRIITATGFLLIIGCNAPRESPKSMCDLPRSFANWQNTPVRWQGVLVDAHGMTLVAEDCQRRGIEIQRWPEGGSDDALTQVVQQSWREPGIVRVDVSGRITGDRRLAVSEVHRIEFQQMTEQQETEFWRSKGF